MHHDYELLSSPNFKTRWQASERLLAQNGITQGIGEVGYWLYGGLHAVDPNKPTEKEQKKFEETRKKLKEYIAEHGKKVDYSSLSKEELNTLLLEVCNSFSNAPNGQLIAMLLDLGANWDTKDKWGQTAFFKAMHIYNFFNLQLFIERGANINDTYRIIEDNYHCSVFINCVGWAEPEEVKYMLDYGANYSASDSKGRTALHQQCDTRGYLPTLKYLVQAGVPINAQDEHGKTALHLLCARSSEMAEEVDYLLAQGANPNLLDHVQRNVLHWAVWVWNGGPAVAKVLLKHGVEVDAQDNSGDSPLHIAVKRENAKMVKALLAHEVDTSIHNHEHQTAYQIALEQGYLPIARLLNPKADEDYQNQGAFQEIEQLKKQVIAKLKSGHQYYSSDKEGYTKFLYRKGEFVYERYEEGRTPPHTFSYQSEQEALKWIYEQYRWRPWANENELTIYQTMLRNLR